MNIILCAGEALNCIDQPLQKAVQSEFEAAFDLFEQAGKASLVDHQVQTEISGSQMEYPLLFIHAQGMLMHLQSEISMASHMIELPKVILNAKTND